MKERSPLTRGYGRHYIHGAFCAYVLNAYGCDLTQPHNRQKDKMEAARTEELAFQMKEKANKLFKGDIVLRSFLEQYLWYLVNATATIMCTYDLQWSVFAAERGARRRASGHGVTSFDCAVRKVILVETLPICSLGSNSITPCIAFLST